MKRLLFVVASGVILAACGPIDYINTVTLNATRAVAEARAADAEKYSPYEYWSAVVYLRMAKEKAAYADYELAIDYGERAEKLASDARKLASPKDRSGTGALGGEETPPGLQSKRPAGAAPAAGGSLP